MYLGFTKKFYVFFANFYITEVCVKTYRLLFSE